MPKIAISYRRSDTSAISGRIFDRLAAHYGKPSVFMDVDNIPIGIDFRAHIGATLRRTDVVLAIIGARWMGAQDGGEARIREESDPVRVEIETAFARGAPVIPVLVDGAKMPDAAALPQSLETFAFLNAAEVATGRDFDGQIGRLIAAIDRAAAAKPDDAASIYASSKAESRRKLLLDAARYFVTPLILLLAAHFLVVVALDWNIVYLWLASLIAPLIFGATFSWFSGRGAGAACGFAIALGLVAAAGMTVSESLATGDPMLPQSRLEWLENFQFAAGMALSFVAGYFAASVSRKLLSSISRA
jgi:TIR domain